MNTAGPENTAIGLIQKPTSALAYSMTLWIALLAYIPIQKKWIPRRRSSLVVQLEMLLTLATIHFVLGGFKYFIHTPDLVPALLTLSLWLSGVATYHWSYRNKSAAKQQTLFLLPFALPFLFITLLLDLFSFVEDWKTLSLISFAGLGIVMIFIPALFQLIWRCQPVSDLPLLERFQEVCTKANFKHAGIKTWTVMNDAHTAAIIGVVPSYRYIMFTKRILQQFKPEWLEAILAHEIGHSKHRHLIIYPFITLGMVLLAGGATLLSADYVADSLADSAYIDELLPLALFSIFGVTVALAFRLLFGYFSRLFERQADLYIFNLGIDATHMIEALNEVGTLSGHTHNKPNWHHYSINERIAFIRGASMNPALIADHNRKVRRSLTLYFIALTLLFIGLVL